VAISVVFELSSPSRVDGLGGSTSLRIRHMGWPRLYSVAMLITNRYFTSLFSMRT